MIDPTELRIALAKHTPFKCQEMNDANELLDTIYECFAQSQVGCCVLGASGTCRLLCWVGVGPAGGVFCSGWEWEWTRRGGGTPVSGSGKRAGRRQSPLRPRGLSGRAVCAVFDIIAPLPAT